MRGKHLGKALWAWLTPAALLIGLLCFTRGVGSLDAGQADAALDRLTRAVRRSAVACYAAEGRYPSDLAYLEERYGLQIDNERYSVVYESVGPNLMPQITVLECQP